MAHDTLHAMLEAVALVALALGLYFAADHLITRAIKRWRQ